MNIKKILKDKKGVFGLTAVQSFFAIILGLALLAYIIVIVMGTLNTTEILSQFSDSVTNETGVYVNITGYTLTQSTLDGFQSATVTAVWANVSGTPYLLPASNYTLTGNSLVNATIVPNATQYNDATVSYTYYYNSVYQSNLNSILGNTSSGVTSFFSAINPIYAILAVLVIILVLVVLVRVVQTPNRGSAPQL